MTRCNISSLKIAKTTELLVDRIFFSAYGFFYNFQNDY